MKEDGTRYAAADVIALANNGVIHLLSNVKYELVGQEIESVNNPGIAGVLMGIAKYPYDCAYGTGLIQCWSPETSDGVLMERAFARRKEYIIQKSAACSVLQSSWRICLVSAKIMTRWCMASAINSTKKVMVMLSTATAKGKVELTKVAWVMPRVHPNDVKKFSLYRSIESKIILDAAFRMRQCGIAEMPAQMRTSLLILRSTNMSSTTKCSPSFLETITGWIR